MLSPILKHELDISLTKSCWFHNVSWSCAICSDQLSWISFEHKMIPLTFSEISFVDRMIVSSTNLIIENIIETVTWNTWTICIMTSTCICEIRSKGEHHTLQWSSVFNMTILKMCSDSRKQYDSSEKYEYPLLFGQYFFLNAFHRVSSKYSKSCNKMDYSYYATLWNVDEYGISNEYLKKYFYYE